MEVRDSEAAAEIEGETGSASQSLGKQPLDQTNLAIQEKEGMILVVPEKVSPPGVPQERNGEPVVRLMNLMEPSANPPLVIEDTSGSSLVMNSYPSGPPVVEDIEEEAQNERERRRSSMREQEKLAFMAKFKNTKNSERVATKLLSLLGNIDVIETYSTSHNRAEDKKLSFIAKEIADNLRWYREYAKNYTEVYLTKTKLLYIIVLKILSQYQKKVREAQDYFKKMSMSMMKYFEGKPLTIEIVEKMSELQHLLKNFELQRRSVDEEFADLDQLFATLGESQPSLLGRTGSPTAYTSSTTNMHRESVIHATVETEESRKIHLDPNCPEMIKQIVHAADSFQDSFARLYRKLAKSKTSSGLFDLYEDFADPLKNPFVLEHNMTLCFQSCSLVMFTCILPKLFEVHRQVTQTILQGKAILEVLYKRDLHLLSETVLFPLSSTLPSNFKRYIKSKLGLEDKKILKDEDLKEFLVQKHLLSYPRISLLWKAAQLCMYKTKTKKQLQVLLVIDVDTFLSPVHRDPHGPGAARGKRELRVAQKPRPRTLDQKQHLVRRGLPPHPNSY